MSGKLIGAVIAVGLVAIPLVGCAGHATSNASVRPGSDRPSSSSPVASVVTSPPPASPTPCPAESGWTGENLSTAPANPAAWLTPAQMPDAAIYHWTAQGPPIVQPFAQDVWNPLFGVSVNYFVAWQEQPYQGNGVAAEQTIFLYTSAAQAHCQYLSAVAEAMGTQALNRSTQAQFGIPADAITTETVSGDDDSAWIASWTGPPTGEIGHGPQTDVDYIAQVGTAVTFVGFDLPGLNDAVPDHAAAQAILNTITQHLSVYASGS